MPPEARQEAAKKSLAEARKHLESSDTLVATIQREKDNVEKGAKEEDELCVICQDRTRGPVQVRRVLPNLQVYQIEM